MKKTRVLIQGWRGISHSYALVNQFQLLELLKHDDLVLFHEDLPFADARWSTARSFSGFSESDTARINAIPRADGPVDAVYRISFPYRLYGGDCRKIFCFGTSETQTLDAACVYRGPVDQIRYANETVEIVTPSNWSKRGFVKVGAREDQVHVVPHGVDPTIFRPALPDENVQMRARLGIPPDAFVFLSAGAMTHNKGIDKLLLAFADIHRRHRHATLLLKDQSSLYALTAKKTIAAVKLSHPGVLDAALGSIGVLSENYTLEDMRLLYGVSDAYVSPYKSEGFALTPLEAAACGVPIVVTAGGATDDYAQPSFALKIASKLESKGAETWLEPELDSVIACMETLIEKRGAELNPAKGAAWIAENFSWARAAEKLAALFTG